jgi:hypothetical protein
MTYVKTQFGNIHINDIPIVVPETFGSKFKIAIIFFSIIVIIILIFMYNAEWDEPEEIDSIDIESFTNKILTNVKASSIDIYENDDIYLENIVIITTDNNLIDIDVLRNKYVKTMQTDTGTIYSIDFKSELDIKEIILISDENHYINHINVNLFNDGAKVWEYSGFLPGARENSIMISKQIFKPTLWKSNAESIDVMDTTDASDKKIIMNENQLSVQLSEDGNDKFIAY